mgnify:FL=1
MIEVKNLRKNFGPLDVLKDINLEIQDGEIYGLVGKSGAGKSTLLRCVNGLESYSAGSLKVNGVEVKDLDKNGLRMLRKDIGMIFQQFPMMTRKTVFENIAFPMKCWKYNKTEIKSRVEELAEIVGIADKLKEKPTTLSGGQKQRVAIARALSMNPKILLSDEATSALDPTTTKAILNLLFEINQRLGITILFVTHQMEVVRQICGRMSLLENGEMTLSGEVDKLFLSGSSMLRQFLGEETAAPQQGVNLRIMLLDDDHSRKMLSRIARELEVEYKICGGGMENYRGKQLGDMMINLEEKDALRVKAFLDEEKIIWHEC